MIMVPDASLKVGGFFVVDHYRAGRLIASTVEKNVVPNGMLDHILNVVFDDATQISTWYVGIFKNNYTPLSTDTLGGGFLTSAGEAAAATDYQEALRPTYVPAASTAQSTTNSASKADFTILTTFTAYGCFLCSASSGSTGTLGPTVKFGTAKSVEATDVLSVTYTINASSV